MRVFPFLLLGFFLIPLVEIYLLIQIGSWIGAAWTITLVVATAVVGAYLVKAQGLSTLQRVQASLQRHELPAVELLEGLALLVAGALLLTPGFFTDAVGFGLLTPPLRRALMRQALARGVLRGNGQAATNAPRPRTLEGEYHELDD